MLTDLLRQKSHVLSSAEEEILSQTEAIASAADNIFAMLNEADIAFPNIKNEHGEMVPLTNTQFTTFMQNPNRDVRKAAFDAFFDTYMNFKNTFATTYSESVKRDCFYANVRKYPSSLQSVLDVANIPESVYSGIVDAVNDNLPLLHRYVAILKRRLGLDEIHSYDLHAPVLPEAESDVCYEDAISMVTESLAPLGEDYLNMLNHAFDNRWIDVYETKSKRGGAYCWGTYGVHPYILLNYNNRLNDAFTLTHELGHALHSHYSWQSQPYIYAYYKLFVAEIASTVNETLLMHHLMQTAKNKDERLSLVSQYIKKFQGSIFRQTMFAEFEKTTHEANERNETLTVDVLNNLYLDLCKKYFGPNFTPDDKLAIEWARIPHFYNAFYVYQYATGFCAAVSLTNQILTEGQPAVERYLNFLKTGGSKHPLDTLKDAGVDVSKPDAYQSVFKVLEDLLDELDK